MHRRHWMSLDKAKTYTLKAENGWAFTPQADGTVSLAYSATATATASVDLSMDPDPGQGEKYPPGND